MSLVDVLPALPTKWSPIHGRLTNPVNRPAAYLDSFGGSISDLKKHKRWILVGSALRIWEDDLKSRVGEIILDNEGQIYKKCGVRPATTRHCWMMGKNHESARPTVVIAHAFPHILKKTMKILSRHGAIGQRGFKLFGCPNCDLQLMYCSSSAQLTCHLDPTTLSLPLSIGGAEVAVGNPARYATLGGTLVVSGERYALTVAHVFTEVNHISNPRAIMTSDIALYDMNWATSTVDEPGSDDEDDIEANNLQLVKIGEAASHSNESTQRSVAVQNTDSSLLTMNMGRFDGVKISSERPFLESNNTYDGMDWALLKIKNHCYHGINRVSHTTMDGDWLNFETVGEKDPLNRVLVITRKGVVHGIGAGSASSIRFHGSSIYRDVWSVQCDRLIEMGDSGAWVVDALNGDFYGVIVAASEFMQEGYMIPAKEILRDIKRVTGASSVGLPQKHDCIDSSLVLASEPAVATLRKAGAVFSRDEPPSSEEPPRPERPPTRSSRRHQEVDSISGSHWFCGHCQGGPMNMKLHEYCVHCERQRDTLARRVNLRNS